MITMRKAITQNRKTFALPGRVDSDNFRGNHSLIKSQQAQLVETSADIIQSYENLFSIANQPIHKPYSIALEKEEATLYEQLPNEELSFDEIAAKTKLSATKLNILLMSLVIKKIIKEFPGKVYKKHRTEYTVLH